MKANQHLYRLSRPGIVALAACTLLLVQACSGGSSSTQTTTPSAKSLSSAQGTELVAYVQAALRQRAAQGWYDRFPLAIAELVGAPSASTGAAGATVSSTTVQEAGVDEDDLLKTDGEQLFSVSYRFDASGTLTQGVWLQSHRAAADATVQPIAERKVLDALPQHIGLQLASANKRLALLSSSWQSNKSITNIDIVSTKPEASLQSEQSLAVDGQLHASRLIGSTLYLVTVSTPALPVDLLAYSATAAEREAAISQTSAAQIIPRVRVNGGDAQALFAPDACYLQAANAASTVQITSITAIDLSSPSLDRSSRCFVGGTESVYMAKESLYLSTTRFKYAAPDANNLSSLTIWRYPAQMTTDIHKFSVQGQSVQYRGSGEVAGHLGWDANKKPYRMGEHEGLLRVISFTGSSGWWGDAPSTGTIASPAQLTVLKENSDKGQLEVLSTLPNAQAPAPLGKPGEQIYSVRFQEDKAYLVTFRQTDPLYVLDLSTASEPRIAGELSIPGYSDYLLPIGNGLLLGIGKDASELGTIAGVKVALFDVSNSNNPTTLATKQYGNRGSDSGLSLSPHAISLLTQGNSVRIALPMRIHESGAVSSWYSPSYQALFGLEVQIAQKTLTDRGSFGRHDFVSNASLYDGQAYGVRNLAYERSAFIDSKTFYLSGGQLRDYSFAVSAP
jgi:uncharacterized secreted protein with C-terminal beta-propeller domain